MVPVSVLHDTTLRMALDYAGVAVFAASGALVAARRGFDIVTFAFFAAVTGIGGGTLRDLLIGAPVFWVSNPGYVGVCIAAAGVVWAIGDRLARFRTLLWLDALGLAAYCVVGASKAADWGAPPLVAVVMGVLTASFGGVVRDVLAGEPSVLLRKEIYVTAAVAGAGTFVLSRFIAPDAVAAALGIGAAFVLRAGALAQGWSLPGFGRGGEVETERPAPATSVPIVAGPDPVTDPPTAASPTASPVVKAPPKPRAPRPAKPKPPSVTPTAMVEPAPAAAEKPARKPRRPKSAT